MSLFTPFGRLTSIADARLNGTPPVSISIPAWQAGPPLEPILWSDILGADVLDALPLTRAAALKIPAVARARHLIAGTIARLPLLAYRGATRLDPAATPRWCYATDGQLGRYSNVRTLGLTGGQSPWQRMIGTIDDHLFYGGSLWLITDRYPTTATASNAVESAQDVLARLVPGTPPDYWATVDDRLAATMIARLTAASSRADVEAAAVEFAHTVAARDAAVEFAAGDAAKLGRPRSMVRVPFDSWYLDDAGAYVDADNHPLPVDYADLVYLPGAHEGLLTIADVTLRQAGAMERTATDVARHPFRLELHQTTETPLGDDEIAAMVAAARKAMIDTVGVLFTNAAIETKDHAIGSGDLLIAGRNQTALDVARHASMPATMLDAVATGASLTYETAVTRNQQWLDYGLAMYLDAVEARLSMDDIVPSGQRIGFDVDALTSLPPIPAAPED